MLPVKVQAYRPGLVLASKKGADTAAMETHSK